MSEIINHKDREGILKLIALSVCVLELLIILFTLTYQQDVVKRTETPITEEMARVYISNPERLKPNERLGLNPYSSMRNQQTYLLVKEVEEVIPFPWKAWILSSVGVPIGIAFLVLLLSKAYFQVVEPEENEAAENSGKFVSALNRLNQINIIWFLLLSIVVLFLFWYIPEIVKYTGGVAMTWLTEYWWFPATIFLVGVSLVVFYVYLQYKLRLKAMNMEMELAKFKFLELQGDSRGASRILIEDNSAPSIRLLEEPHLNDEQTEKKASSR